MTAGLCLLGSCVGASALSLGELAVRSGIGQTFDATLPFVAQGEDNISAQCIRTLDDAAAQNQHLPLLANLRLEIRQRSGGGEIVIRSRSIVNEPAVRLRLTVDCGTKTILVREFVVLLDALAPDVPAAAAPAASPPDRSPLLEAQQPLPRPRVRAAAGGGAAGQARPVMPSLRMTGPVAAEPAGVSDARRKSAGRPSGYRLTLSRPGDRVADDVPLILALKRSEELLSLAAPPRAFAGGEIERLHAEARIRMSDNPFAEAVQLQSRLATLESGVTGLRAQISELDAARRAAEERAGRQGEENRRLVSLINSLAVGAAFVVLALLLALTFWRFRIAGERRETRARDWNSAAVAAPVAARSVQAEATDEDADPYQRTVVLERPAASAAEPARAGGPPLAREPSTRREPALVPGGSVPSLSEVDLYLPESALAGRRAAAERSASVGATQAPAASERTRHTAAVEVSEKDREPVTTIEYALPGTDHPVARPDGSQDPPDREGIDFLIDSSEPRLPEDPAREEAAARAAQYLAEFERKLFPEIAFGRVRLDDPRSIIGLARTYYQEDFDPGKAVSFLEYALHRSTDPMLIHLALLEVLRLERRVGEYATLARAFRGQYPDSGTHWQLVAAYGRLMDPADPTFAGDKVPGLDLDTPSNWLGSTLDMTKYVLGQKVADSLRDLPAPSPAEGA